MTAFIARSPEARSAEAYERYPEEAPKPELVDAFLSGASRAPRGSCPASAPRVCPPGASARHPEEELRPLDGPPGGLSLYNPPPWASEWRW